METANGADYGEYARSYSEYSMSMYDILFCTTWCVGALFIGLALGDLIIYFVNKRKEGK